MAMKDDPRPSTGDVLVELKRERQIRGSVYPGQIAIGKLDRVVARVRNERLDEAIRVFEELAAAEKRRAEDEERAGRLL